MEAGEQNPIILLIKVNPIWRIEDCPNINSVTINLSIVNLISVVETKAYFTIPSLPHI